MMIRRMFCDCAPLPAIAVMIVVCCSAAALSEESGPIQSGPGQGASAAGTSSSCPAGIRTFVTELDGLLAVFPQAYASYYSLMDRSFPLKGCVIEEVISICKQSRYFAGVGDNAGHVVIAFNNGKFFPGRGHHVSFSLDKNTGDTRYPSVRSNRVNL